MTPSQLYDSYFQKFRTPLQFVMTRLPRTYSTLRRRGEGDEDIEQLCCIEIWRASERFNEKKSTATFPTVANAYIKRGLINRVRATQRYVLPTSNQEVPDNRVYRDRGFEDSDNREFVKQVLERLSPKDRAVVESRFMDGWSLQKIAKDLGVHTNAVFTRLLRIAHKARLYHERVSR